MGDANQEYQLQRIAAALEGINSELRDIRETLESCTAVTDHGNFLCVTGNISNY